MQKRRPLALITGATGGIGQETALQIAQLGWSVIITGRDAKRGQAALDKLQYLSGFDDHRLWLGDLSDLDAVAELGAWIRTEAKDLQLLINNAGGAFPEKKWTRQGREMTYALNVLSPIRLVEEVMPVLRRQRYFRIVNVNSMLHHLGRHDATDPEMNRGRYNGWQAYANAKFAMMSWTLKTAAQVPASEGGIFAVDPGISETDSFQQNWKNPWMAGLGFALRFSPQYLSPRKAARSSVIAGTSARLQGLTGKFLDVEGRRAKVCSGLG